MCEIETIANVDSKCLLFYMFQYDRCRILYIHVKRCYLIGQESEGAIKTYDTQEAKYVGKGGGSHYFLKLQEIRNKVCLISRYMVM